MRYQLFPEIADFPTIWNSIGIPKFWKCPPLVSTAGVGSHIVKLRDPFGLELYSDGPGRHGLQPRHDLHDPIQQAAAEPVLVPPVAACPSHRWQARRRLRCGPDCGQPPGDPWAPVNTLRHCVGVNSPPGVVRSGEEDYGPGGLHQQVADDLPELRFVRVGGNLLLHRYADIPLACLVAAIIREGRQANK